MYFLFVSFLNFVIIADRYIQIRTAIIVVVIDRISFHQSHNQPPQNQLQQVAV